MLTEDINQGLEGVLHAGLQEIGQIFSRQLVRVEITYLWHNSHLMIRSVWVGREDDTTEENREGERDFRFRLNKTGRGVGVVEAGRCRLKVIME